MTLILGLIDVSYDEFSRLFWKFFELFMNLHTEGQGVQVARDCVTGRKLNICSFQDNISSLFKIPPLNPFLDPGT